MRLLLTAAAIVVLLLNSLTAGAAIVSEDVAYWYWTGQNGTLGTVFNPNQAWLDEFRSALVVKVQQTVYDPTQAAQILSNDGQQTDATGYLYAYSVSNLDWTDGLSGFGAIWGVEPLLVTKSNRVTPASWAVNGSVTYPEWRSTPANVPGIAPGETVGGFWALSSQGEDGVCPAGVMDLSGQWLEGGLTTGPVVPDPASIVTLAAGLMGMGAVYLRRK